MAQELTLAHIPYQDIWAQSDSHLTVLWIFSLSESPLLWTKGLLTSGLWKDQKTFLIWGDQMGLRGQLNKWFLVSLHLGFMLWMVSRAISVDYPFQKPRWWSSLAFGNSISSFDNRHFLLHTTLIKGIAYVTHNL
jgi:hypothetical protein